MGKLLDEFRSRFYGDIQGSGGCDTCGFGAENGMSEEEFDKLLIEIDEWAEKTFKNVSVQRQDLPSNEQE